MRSAKEKYNALKNNEIHDTKLIIANEKTHQHSENNIRDEQRPAKND